MDARKIRFDCPSLRAYLASRATKAKLAEILRRWAGPRHLAVLFVVDGGDWCAGVWAEEELLGEFPQAPVVLVEPTGWIAPGLLLIFVVEEQGATIYAIADPRATN
jgi:hypothetical protein